MRQPGVWCLAASLGVLAAVCPARAQQTEPNLEDCTKWDYDNDRFQTVNTCDKPVSVRFMAGIDRHLIERQLEPGDVFKTGLRRKQIDASWWIFTTCAVGYESTLDFGAKNREAIIASDYACRKK